MNGLYCALAWHVVMCQCWDDDDDIITWQSCK